MRAVLFVSALLLYGGAIFFALHALGAFAPLRAAALRSVAPSLTPPAPLPRPPLPDLRQATPGAWVCQPLGPPPDTPPVEVLVIVDHDAFADDDTTLVDLPPYPPGGP
jgi:hypothetical protein